MIEKSIAGYSGLNIDGYELNAEYEIEIDEGYPIIIGNDYFSYCNINLDNKSYFGFSEKDMNDFNKFKMNNMDLNINQYESKLLKDIIIKKIIE